MPKTIFSSDHERLLNLLKSKRKSAGVSQVELAKKLKVPQSYVSKIKTGERRLDLIELQAVCHALGVTLTSFVQEFESV